MFLTTKETSSCQFQNQGTVECVSTVLTNWRSTLRLETWLESYLKDVVSSDQSTKYWMPCFQTHLSLTFEAPFVPLAASVRTWTLKSQRQACPGPRTRRSESSASIGEALRGSSWQTRIPLESVSLRSSNPNTRLSFSQHVSWSWVYHHRLIQILYWQSLFTGQEALHGSDHTIKKAVE